jgi:hypothetical protein
MAMNQLLRLWSVVSKRRLPDTWASEFTRKVMCQHSTVLRKKPMIRPGQPAMREQPMASRVGGTRKYLLSHMSSGYLAKSWMREKSVSAVLSKSQPMCEYQKPSSTGECVSPTWSLCLWWLRWCEAHQSTPFCAVVWARKASRNWKTRLVL